MKCLDVQIRPVAERQLENRLHDQPGDKAAQRGKQKRLPTEMHHRGTADVRHVSVDDEMGTLLNRPVKPRRGKAAEHPNNHGEPEQHPPPHGGPLEGQQVLH